MGVLSRNRGDSHAHWLLSPATPLPFAWVTWRIGVQVFPCRCKETLFLPYEGTRCQNTARCERTAARYAGGSKHSGGLSQRHGACYCPAVHNASSRNNATGGQ